MSKKLDVVLKTTLSLVEQFQSTLSSHPTNSNPADDKTDDPLRLLSAAAAALKSHVTKLSLLTITSPFTPSAVTAILSTLNEFVLPSLVTASLLITPSSHTKAFQSDIRILASTALKETALLIREVQVVAEEKADRKSLDKSEKDTVTVAVGRVWDACDVLVDIAAKGVIGFVVRRAEEYRDLVRDAVEEIEQWDPEDDDDFFDDLLGEDGGTGRAVDDEDEDGDDDDDEDTAAQQARKKDALRILKPVAQIYPALISNRLKKGPASLEPSTVGTLESLLKNLQQIPNHIDEVAGALYEDDVEKYTSELKKAKSCASKAIELVTMPWGSKSEFNAQKDAGDKFTTWSKTWIEVVEQVSKSTDGPGSKSG
ncbi:uncharacterized protein BDV14DRAFT_173106 [Aspergillus stella-maris]|uniref:uncharacterized protein n=1 Tax=Aspergillus stella-maris TaxID=1810926 RepID=UPI003CCDAB72